MGDEPVDGTHFTATAVVADDATVFVAIDDPAPNVDVAVSAEPLSSEILKALEADTESDPEYGSKIHDVLSQKWVPLLEKGLPSNYRAKLNKKYLIPENCKLLQAPKLNADISAAIHERALNCDNVRVAIQQQLGIGITAVNRALDVIITRDDNYIINAVKYLSDACRLFCDLHHIETQSRIGRITPDLEEIYFNVVQGTKRDETLFGSNLPEKIKSAETQILQFKNTFKHAPVASTSQSKHTQTRVFRSARSRYSMRGGGRRVRKRLSSLQMPETQVTSMSTGRVLPQF